MQVDNLSFPKGSKAPFTYKVAGFIVSQGWSLVQSLVAQVNSFVQVQGRKPFCHCVNLEKITIFLLHD